jgi:hypothetical protein
MMNTEQPKRDVAQPAQESLKKHGDQLEKSVEEAAGKRMPDGEERKTGKSAGNQE